MTDETPPTFQDVVADLMECSYRDNSCLHQLLASNIDEDRIRFDKTDRLSIFFRLHGLYIRAERLLGNLEKPRLVVNNPPQKIKIRTAQDIAG